MRALPPVLGVMVMLLAGLLSGCAGSQAASPGIQAGNFSIVPGEIRVHQTLTITLPKAHPANMAIRTPEGRWYWVQDPAENILLMPDAAFKAATRITFTPSRLTGTSWVKGKRVVGPVFQSAGEYLIYFADNLETEPENTFHFMGKVKFIQ